MRLNILFILSDQHTRKIAGCYGDEIAITPHLDRLAAQGVTFDATYCPAPICTPSRMSMLTGRWPYEQQSWTLDDSLSSDIPTFVHALGGAGYRTILCGRLHAVGPDQLHGFSERYVGDCSPNWLGAKRQELGVLAGAQGPSALAEDDPVSISIRLSGSGQSGYEVVDDATTEAACGRLQELGVARDSGDNTPFFLSVGYLLPHCPFVARASDFALFDGRVSSSTLPRSINEHPWITAWRSHAGTAQPRVEDIIRARTAYYALVHALDRKIGKVIGALEKAGLADNTLIIYASDHGEQLGDRDLWWKNTFYEESVGVPLLMALPGQLPQGVRIGNVVNLVDLGATVLAAADAAPLKRSNGRNLIPLARDPSIAWDNETYAEYVTDSFSPWTGAEPTQQRMLRCGKWKLVAHNGYRPQLFDLENDPQELLDLGEDDALEAIRSELLQKVTEHWDAEKIAQEVLSRCYDKQVLREWGSRTRPASTYQFALSASDSWLDRSGK